MTTATAGMGWNLKRCCTGVDRLTSLPDDLLGRILSLLTTKDVVATQLLSKRMRKALSWITSVDLDDSPISFCIDHPLLVERFPLFKSFVKNVFHQLLHYNQSLTRFRLHFGENKNIPFNVFNPHSYDCKKACFPYFEPARLNAWISYPLAHSGLRELDLSFHVNNLYDSKLPPPLFASQSLEVLKLDSNLAIDDYAHIPLISLPNLKLLNLRSFVFTEDGFVSRLVSSCPVLEDLSITCCTWEKSHRLIISSHSLQRLVLLSIKWDKEKNSDLVLIDTPNLQYLHYLDNLASRYSVAHLNALVEARINIVYIWQSNTLESSFRSQLSLVKSLSSVQRLSLLGTSPETVYIAADALKDQLPVFRNLRTLELDSFFNSRWDIMLLPILNCSPLLETLVFPQRLFKSFKCSEVEAAALEADGWRTAETPSCCLTHLKRIEFGRCYGIDRELNMIKFLLRKASVLKELVISLICILKKISVPAEDQFDVPNSEQFERTLKELPRASNSCCITLRVGSESFTMM